MNARIVTVAALFALASCGGGGGNSATPSAGTTASKTATGNVMISIPISAGTTTGRVRYPQFVSPNIQSVAVSVNGGADVFFNVGTGSTICTTTNNTRNCALSFGAPVGSDSFGFLVFAGANGSGATLGSASTTQTVTSQGFGFTLALNPAIGAVGVQLVGNSTGCPNAPAGNSNTNAIDEGCPGHATAALTVTDPSLATITGTTAFATPITITTDDPSITPSPASITAPGQTVTFNYSGAAFASATATVVTISFTVGNQTIPFMVPLVHANLYVANSNAPFGSQPAGGGNVAVYAFGANGNATPLRTLQGSGTSLLQTPAVPLIDSGGFLFVLDDGTSPSFNPSIKVFSPGASGAALARRQISNIGAIDGSSTCQDMVFDPTKQFLFVACGSNIYVFSASLSGNASGNVLATYTSGGFPNGIGFDPSGNFYVADSSENALYIFAGQIATSGTHTLSSPNSIDGFDNDAWPSTLTPFHFAVDNSGTLYMPLSYLAASPGAPDTSAELGIWKSADLTNNGVATGMLTGLPFTTHAVTGVAVDYLGNVYAANSVTNTITVFAPATIPAAHTVTNPTVVSNPPAVRTLNATAGGATTAIGITVGP